MRKLWFFLLSLAILACPSPTKAQHPHGVSPEQVKKAVLELPSDLGPGYWAAIEKAACIKGQLAKLPPTPVKYERSLLSPRDVRVLQHLIDASRYMDRIFLRQVYVENEKIEKRLSESKDPVDGLLYHYFRINFGPFDRLNGFKNFIGIESHPPGANFYPQDMTKEEFEKWLQDHPNDREAFTSLYTVIRRHGKDLVAIPYSQEYRDLLVPAARSLESAAEFTDNVSFKHFLKLRSRALLTDDYYESDIAWMDIKDSLLEITIGPFEVYEDGLFNYKAAYEAYVTLNLPEEEKKLAGYCKYLRDMEANLPLPDTDKNLNRKFESPIRVVQEIFTAGEAKSGIQTSAFNLPNDERVREAKGCKKVLLKNVMEAKFRQSTMPICRMVVDEAQQVFVTFRAYFRNVLFHELSHGLGPGLITLKDGSRVDSRTLLKENYSALEECKADILGIYNQLYLYNRGIIPKEELPEIFTSDLAGIFRSARFGTEEAHGKGTLVRLNWMIKEGAIVYDANRGRYRVVPERFRQANRSLVETVLRIMADGDYERSKKFLKEYAFLPQHLTKTLSLLYEIPVDIEPVYMH